MLSLANQLIALEESLSANTSTAYAEALETLAGAHQAAGDMRSELQVRRQIVEIADMVASRDTVKPRMQVANALVRARDLEEANHFAAEALSLRSYLSASDAKRVSAEAQAILQLR